MRAAGQGAVVRRDGQARRAQRTGAEALGGREIMSAAPVAASAIAALIKDAMMAVAVPGADAAKVAELMLEADLAGADAHGVFRLPHDMIGIYSAVANANHMPAWGAAESLLSTNPIAIAVPAGEEPPVVLDIATTVVSYGTVKAYKLQGKPMPEGWMIGAKDGKPITDSARSGEGLLMPIGGHKGSGLALVLGLLAGVLNGAAFGREVVDFNADDESACNTGHFIIALDVSRFLPIAAFKAQIDRQLRDLKSSS